MYFYIISLQRNCELIEHLCSERLFFRVLCLQYLHKLLMGTSGKHQNSGKKKKKHLENFDVHHNLVEKLSEIRVNFVVLMVAVTGLNALMSFL